MAGRLRVVVESVGLQSLPSELAALKGQVNSFTLRIPELTLDVFHKELTTFLGGPIPVEQAKYFLERHGREPRTRFLVDS